MSSFAFKKKPVFAKAVPKQKSVFEKFTPKVVDVDPDAAEIINIVERMLEIGTSLYWGFVILSKDKLVLKEICDLEYTVETVQHVKNLHPDHQFQVLFSGFPFRNLAAAAAQICSNVCYSDDGGEAYTAMNGNGRIDDRANWVVDKVKKDKNVVSVTSAHAVDLQLFVASVDVALTQTVAIVKNVSQTISVPSLVQKNVVQGMTLDTSIKTIFHGLVVSKEDDTEEDFLRAPWIWKRVHAACKDTAIPVVGVPLQLIYFALVQSSFGYTPYSLNMADVFYKNYDNIPKDILNQVSKHSVYRGGYFLSKFHYMNKGLGLATSKRVGGFFPVKWCMFNTQKNVTWERDGATIEGGGLGTTVEPPRAVEEFDGLFYDPAKCVDKLGRAAGLIIPYDPISNGLAIMETWISKKLAGRKLSDVSFRMWASYGQCPLLWIEESDRDGEAKGSATRYSRAAADCLWKAMGTMPLYNFSCSLNVLAARDSSFARSKTIDSVLDEMDDNDIPYEPILAAIFTRADEYATTYEFETGDGLKKYSVPAFIPTRLRIDGIPGRHMIGQGVKPKTEGLAEKWDDYEEFGAHHSSGRGRTDAPRKKMKVDDDEAPKDRGDEGMGRRPDED